MASFTKTIICTPIFMGMPTNIQEAINRLNGKPGTVLLEAGEYDITSSAGVITIPSNISVIGLGAVTINVKTLLTGALIYSMNTINARLENINIVICEEAKGYKENLIFFQNTKHSNIRSVNVTAQDGAFIKGGVAILLYARDGKCEGNTISQCRVTNYHAQAFNMTTHMTYTFPRPHTCNNNTIRDCYTNQVLTGCCMTRADYNLVQGNTFINSYGDITSPHTDPINQGHDGALIQGNGNRVIGNNLSGNSEHGLYSSGSKDSIFANNICNDNYCAGLKLRHAENGDEFDDDCRNVISGNICNNNGQDPFTGGNGIHLQDGANHNILSANICHGNNGDGIRVHCEGAIANVISGNNIVHGNKAGQIVVENSGNFVLDNTCLSYYIGV